jgi:hypothetical protein
LFPLKNHNAMTTIGPLIFPIARPGILFGEPPWLRPDRTGSALPGATMRSGVPVALLAAFFMPCVP